MSVPEEGFLPNLSPDGLAGLSPVLAGRSDLGCSLNEKSRGGLGPLDAATFVCTTSTGS
ncbi:hypothetical protein KA478_02050 [Patescibacteria group bacterium]|nr:hypothetical protein [Patescibacteria group bacterium]